MRFRAYGGGRAAIAAALMRPDRPGRFAWVPIATRRAGDLGFTVGHLTYRALASPDVWRGTYVTIWRRAADGRWMVLFHTRRSAPAVLREPEA